MFTNTYIKNFILENDDLGSFIRIPIPKNHDSYPYLDMYDQGTLNVQTANFVFFKPKPGALITGFTEWYTANGKEHYKTSPRSFSTYEADPQSRPLSESIGKNENLWEKHPEAIGCRYIGIEYNYQKIYNSEDIVGEDSIDILLYYINAIGRSDYVKLHTITTDIASGNENYPQALYYTNRTSDTYQTTYVVIPHYGESHTYTNLVACLGNYEIDGTTYKDQYTLNVEQTAEDYDELPSIYQAYITSSDDPLLDYANETLNARVNFSSEKFKLGRSATTSNGLYFTIVSNPQETPMITVLAYIDCYLCIFSPTYQGDGYTDGTKTINDGGDSDPTIIKHHHQLILSNKSIKLYDTDALDIDNTTYIRGNDVNCYQSIFDYEKFECLANLRPQNANDRLTDMVVEEYNCISYMNRWIRAFAFRNMDSSMKISGFYNIVELIGKNDSSKIKKFAKCISQCTRFTRYWCMCKDNSIYNDNFQVVHENDIFPTNELCNRIAYPILKPWAAVEFIVFCDDTLDGSDSTVFGHDHPNANEIYKCMHKMLDQNYGKYYTTILFNATDIDAEIATASSSEEKRKQIVKHFADYYQIKSPFRIEHYMCHGMRVEYDVNSTRKNNGKVGFCVAKNFGMRSDAFDRLHSKCPDGSKFVVFSQACFGSGINYSISRSPDTHLYQSCISQNNNSFGWFSACGTHIGYGDPLFLGLMAGDACFPILNNAIKTCKQQNAFTYQEIATQHNNIQLNLQSIVFNKILEFYIENYDLMKFFVDDLYKSYWDNTKEDIIQDLKNNGLTYFCRYGNNKTESDFTASDNYIAFDKYGKAYKITDGFIGYIKNAISKNLVPFEGRTWPTKNTIDKYITQQYINFFTEHGYNLWYFLAIASEENYSDLGPTNVTMNNKLWRESIVPDYFADDYVVNRLDEHMKEQDVIALADLNNKLRDHKNRLDAKYTTLENNLAQLVSTIENEYKHISTRAKTPWTAFINPRAHASGLFAQSNAEFMKNPDVEEDAFLTSDADLEELRQQQQIA